MTPLARDVLALFSVGFLGSLACGAGVGGGAIYIPLFILLLSPNKVAIPLSKACTFGASIGMFLVNSRRTRPKQNSTGRRPMIDYKLAALLEPFTLLGTILGVRLNKMLPFPIVAAVMVVVLTMVSAKTFHRAIALHRIESRCDDANDAVDLRENRQRQPASLPTGHDDSQFPMAPILSLMVYWLLGILPSVILSGRFGAFACMSPGYIMVMSGCVLLLLALASGKAYAEVSRQSPPQSRQLLLPGADEAVWAGRSLAHFCAISFMAGIFSALVGVGGSAIKGPFLAHITAPDVASSTAAFMLLSTCSASMFQFILLDMLNIGRAGVFFLVGLGAAFFGTHAWAEVVKRWNKKSIIVFVLAVYVSVATVAMSVVSIYEIENTTSITQLDSIC